MTIPISNTRMLPRREYHLTCDPGRRRRTAEGIERMGLIDTVLVRIFHQKGEIARLAECSVRQHLDNQVEVEVIKDETSFIGRLRIVFHSSSTWLRVKGVNDRVPGPAVVG